MSTFFTKKMLATLVGGIAILLWATLTLFTIQANGLPPFQLLTMCFMVSFLASVLVQIHKLPAVLKSYRQSWQVWLLNVGGLFGCNFFYFIALDLAPPIQASLIAFLWPLLVVLFSALLPNERLRWFHVLGCIISMLGAWLIVTKGGTIALERDYVLGYIAAFICAIVWSGYSVLNRRNKHVQTSAIGGFCLCVSILSSVAHVVFEQTVIPQGGQWLAVLAIGVGPFGMAYFAWDYSVKRGHIQLLGVLSYSTPLLSTLLLLLTRETQWHISILLSCLLIISGSVIASMDLLKKKAI